MKTDYTDNLQQGETEQKQDSNKNNDMWDYFNTTMSTTPTVYRSKGGPKFTPKKPKRRNIKHGNRKKK